MIGSFLKPPLRAARAAFRLVRDTVMPTDDEESATSTSARSTDATDATDAATTTEPTPAPSAAATAPAPQAAQIPIEVFVEETPNPNARKFISNVVIVPEGSLVFNDVQTAAQHPVGQALFEIDGVRTVFMTKDFVTVTSTQGADWRELQPAIWATLIGVLSS